MPCSTGSSQASLSAFWHTSKGGWNGVLRLSMRTPILIAFAVAALAYASGCGSRAVFIPDQSPIRLGPGVRARVWMLVDGQWTLSSNSIDIPEGMYIVPPRFVEENDR